MLFGLIIFLFSRLWSLDHYLETTLNHLVGAAKLGVGLYLNLVLPHRGIGSDLDGGYGNEQTPHDLGTIADLQKLAPLLSARGFGDDDVERFMRGNWVRFFSQHLPA